MASGTDTTTYSYLANSSLIGGVSTTRTGSQIPSLAVTSQFDHLDRLTSVSSTNGTNVVSSHGYTYNELGQRTESVLEDGSKWGYGYDAMGEVIGGNKKWSDNVPVGNASEIVCLSPSTRPFRGDLSRQENG